MSRKEEINDALPIKKSEKRKKIGNDEKDLVLKLSEEIRSITSERDLDREKMAELEKRVDALVEAMNDMNNRIDHAMHVTGANARRPIQADPTGSLDPVGPVHIPLPNTKPTTSEELLRLAEEAEEAMFKRGARPNKV